MSTEDHTGSTYGNLTIVGKAPNFPSRDTPRVFARCVCGVERSTTLRAVIEGYAQKCCCGLGGRIERPLATPKENRIKSTPSWGVLRELLDYKQETGKLFWRERPSEYFPAGNELQWNGRYANTEAFTYLSPQGYYRGNLFDSSYNAHRIIWKWMTGEDSPLQIDHINGDRADNRWSNLREANRAQNFWNAKRRSYNTSGKKGVYFNKGKGKWDARITHYGRPVFLGRFETFEEAKTCRENAEQFYHKGFTNHE